MPEDLPTPEKSLKQLEKEIMEIKERNKRVELDKNGKRVGQEKFVFVY